jgi:diacylglycerol kinase family enzyme
MRIIAIANPIGGSFNKKKFHKCISILESKLGNIEIFYTEFAGHGEEIAFKENADLVISAGGDGIINEIVNGLREKKCLFFPLPFGTANVFCKEHGINSNPLKAAHNFSLANKSEIYLGFINNKYFVQMAGFGFDADAVRNVNLKLKRKLGKFAYIKSGIEILIKGDFKKIKYFYKGKENFAYHLIVSVGEKYAGQFKLVKSKSKDKFSVCFLESKSRFALFKAIFFMLLNIGFSNNSFETSSIKVSSIKYCQIDGDLFELTNEHQHIIVIKKAPFFLVK